ncbi:MAG: hypothetical protein IH855_06200 [Bacteroidetes bacterium]|nr:hypothetical protein [Bacteroidota bacterium]
MLLSETDQQKLLGYMAENWGDKAKCHVCGESDFGISSTIFEIREFHGGSIALGKSKILPVVPVTCSNCGDIRLVGAIKAGILKAEEEPAEEEPAEEEVSDEL